MFSANTKDAANATVNDAKSTLYNAKRDVNEATGDSKTNMDDMAEKAGRQVRGFIDSASSQISDASDRISGEIHDNPVRASLVALGVGFVLGVLFRR